jgi:hypothetical protein
MLDKKPNTTAVEGKHLLLFHLLLTSFKHVCLASLDEIMNALRSAGSNSQSVCDGNDFGYLANDSDDFPGPLLHVRSF